MPIRAVDKALREEQCGFRKGRRYIDQIITLRSIIEKWPSHQTSLVLSFIDYEEVLDSADRRALVKVLSLYGISDKYTIVIRTVYENIIVVVKVGNEDTSWFRIRSGVKQGSVLSLMGRLSDFVVRSTAKAMGDHGTKWGGKTLLDFD